jgi:hypothetical protein
MPHMSAKAPCVLGIGLIPTAVLGDCIGQAQGNLKKTHNNVKIWGRLDRSFSRDCCLQ